MFKKFIVSISIIATLVVCVVGLVGCDLDKGSEDVQLEYTTDSGISRNENDFDIIMNGTVVETMEEPRLLLSSGATNISETGSVTKTINATIYPSTAELLDVVWSVYWTTEPVEGADINDYFILNAYQNKNSRFYTCEVTCIKAFLGGEAKVRVTTVDGGFSDECTLIYAGVPSDISVEYNGENLGSSADIEMTTSSALKNININLSNVLGQVADDYSGLSIKSRELSGQMRVIFSDNNDNYLTSTGWMHRVAYDFDQGIATYTHRIFDIETDEETFFYNSEVQACEFVSILGLSKNKDFFGVSPSDFANITLNGSTLSVTPIMSFRGYFKTVIVPSSAGDQDWFFKYLDSSSTYPPCLVVTVVNDYTGLEAEITIDILTGVTSVNITQDSIVF